MIGSRAVSSVSARKREATCNAILDAASQLVAEKGFDGFTMSEVAQRGKVNRALVYHYYHNRTNLIYETIRFIVNRYDEIRATRGDDEIERAIRLHIEHPEIGRFLFHLMLTGKPLPRLSQRITSAIEDLDRMKAGNLTVAMFDPAFAVITGWLFQVAWSCAREEIARLLGLSVEEADRRFIANTRNASQLIWRAPPAAGQGAG